MSIGWAAAGQVPSGTWQLTGTLPQQRSFPARCRTITPRVPTVPCCFPASLVGQPTSQLIPRTPAAGLVCSCMHLAHPREHASLQCLAAPDWGFPRLCFVPSHHCMPVNCTPACLIVQHTNARTHGHAHAHTYAHTHTHMHMHAHAHMLLHRTTIVQHRTRA